MDLSNLRPADGAKQSDNFRRGRGHGSGTVSYTHLIAGVKTARTNTINVYDVMKYNTVIATKAAVKAIEEVYA